MAQIQIQDDSRLQKKKQKRRRSLFMNVLIGAVLLVAVTVTFQLITSSTSKVGVNNKTVQKKGASDAVQSAAPKNNDTNKDANQTQLSEDKKVVVQDQKDPSVIEAYTKPAWKPIKTSQTEPHTTKYDTSSQDWKEMVQTISYALSIPSDNLTILYIGNNGTNKAVGTVQTKDTKQRYKVYIEWVDNQGWKPALVKQMK